MVITLQQLILAFIIPVAVSLTVAYFSNKRQKKLDFNYDYKKYILDKRKDAYSKVEAILSSFHIVHLNGGRKVFAFFELQYPSTENPLYLFNDKVLEATKSSLWLSATINTHIIKLNSVVNECLKEMKDLGMAKASLEPIGVREFETLHYLYQLIVVSYFQDIIDLDDIDTFKKSKKGESMTVLKKEYERLFSKFNGNKS